LFVDAGRMWPGDVPFGYDSGWRATVGAGLRGSFPAGGRSSFRLDIAAPMTGFEPGKFRFLLSASEVLGIGGMNTADVQVVRSRKENVSGELFRFR
jgi:hypothetical protein